MRIRRTSDRFDWTLILLLILFCLVSCIAIYSGQASGQYEGNFMVKQIFWYVVGVVIIAVVMYFDTDQVKKLSWVLYWFGIFLLFLLAILPVSDFTPERNGAKSWFMFGSNSIQPSEFMKVFLIVTLSKVISTHHEKTLHKSAKTDFILLGKIGVVSFLPFALVMMQPDLGTSLVIIAIATGLVFISGITWKIILPLYGGTMVIAGTILYFAIYAPDVLTKYLPVKTYQFNRIYSWLDPENHQGDSGYQLMNSLKAIGSGLLTGKGFAQRRVPIPESHTDFIFSVIGEEYGFIGGSVVVSLFFLLIYHLTKTALETNDAFNTYICVGIISMISFHVFQNIGMTIQVLPITGIPLPFISYGGSSLMGNMMAMGLIFGIHYHHRNYMFASKH